MRRLLLLAAVGLMLAGCGGSTPETTTRATTSVSQQTVAAYFFRNGALTRVPGQVAPTPMVARAALDLLLTGPPSGYESAIPPDTSLTAVAVAGGVATATFSAGLGQATHSAQGQIVYTLLQFPSVTSVSIVVAGAGPVKLQDGAGHDVGPEATKADYVDLTPDALIFVSTPARDSTVSSPVHLAGTANTFEATFQIEVRSGRRLLQKRTITATSGSGTRGDWSTTLDVPAGDLTVVLYEASAEDGSHLHTTVVPLHVR